MRKIHLSLGLAKDHVDDRRAGNGNPQTSGRQSGTVELRRISMVVSGYQQSWLQERILETTVQLPRERTILIFASFIMILEDISAFSPFLREIMSKVVSSPESYLKFIPNSYRAKFARTSLKCIDFSAGSQFGSYVRYNIYNR